MSVILLSDNGSSKAQVTLQLRKLALKLSERTGQSIYPVSLMHANRIPIEELNGVAAQIFYEFMARQLAQGQREFRLIPIFFGRSKALTTFIPEKILLLQNEYGAFEFEVCDIIYPLPMGEPMLTRIVFDHIQVTASKNQLPLNNIVLVDHGSPVARVTNVRKHLAHSVQNMIGKEVQIEQAVMERRTGSEYDFNGKLLKDWLKCKAQAGETSAVIVLLFFLPGRHAGKGGDIENICQNIMKQYPAFKIAISPLVAEHNSFADILNVRLEKANQ